MVYLSGPGIGMQKTDNGRGSTITKYDSLSAMPMTTFLHELHR